MAQGYQRLRVKTHLPSTLTNIELLHLIATQLEGISNTLQGIAHALAIKSHECTWEMRRLLGLPDTRGVLQCSPPPETTKSSAEF